MLKPIFFFFFLTFLSLKCFSQPETPIYKNEISLGANGHIYYYFPAGFYSVIYKRSIKAIKIVGSFNYRNYTSSPISSGFIIGGDMGITKNAYIFKNRKWVLFYGAELLYFYQEITGEKYNTYITDAGLGLISGLEFAISKHFSLSTQLNPGCVKTDYHRFIKTDKPMIFRNFLHSNNTGFSRFFSLEVNYKF